MVLVGMGVGPLSRGVGWDRSGTTESWCSYDTY